MQMSHKKSERLRAVMERSAVPVAVVEGTPCVISADGAMAWLSGEDRLAPSGFRVKVGDRIMTMEEANKAIAVKDVKTVGAAERRYAQRKFGYDGSLLLLNTTNPPPSASDAADTIKLPRQSGWEPQPTQDFIRRHPSVKSISWGYVAEAKQLTRSDAKSNTPQPGIKAGDMFMTIHFKNGKWDMYNVSDEESVRKFKQNYGELPPAPPAAPNGDDGASALFNRTISTKEGDQATTSGSSGKQASRKGGFHLLAADSLIWSADKNTLTLMGNAMAMDETTETVLKSDAIVLRQSNLEKVFVDGKSLTADDLHLNPQRHALRMQTLTADEATRRYGIDFTGTVLEIITEKVEGKR